MSSGALVWATILLIALGTYLLRASFLLLARRVAALPPRAREALRMIPPAALAALAASALLRPDDGVEATYPRLLAAAVALLVAWRTRRLLPTILVGLAAVVVLEALLG